MRLVKQGKQVISIHAPPRGATLSFSVAASPKQNFNSRPSARGDGRDIGVCESIIDFNSRPSARGDS